MKLKEYLNTPFRRMMARNLALVLVMGIVTAYVALHDSRRLYGESMIFSTMSTTASVDLWHKDRAKVKQALATAHAAIREVEKIMLSP